MASKTNQFVGYFNLDNGIPESNLVKIYCSDGNGGEQLLVSCPLIMDDEVSIKASSKFGELWEASPNNFLNLLSSSFNVPSGQFALQGAQIWQSTDPLDFSVKVDINMDTDPYVEVMQPTFTLMQTCLPRIRKSNKESKDDKFKFITENINLKIKSLIPPGPNLQTLIGLMDKSDTITDKRLLANQDGLNGVYNVKVGFAKFINVIIKKVEPTFSKTMAKSPSRNGELFPSSVSLDIDICTMEVATTDMVHDILTRL